MKKDAFVLKGGCHTLAIRTFLEINGQKTVRIECIDDMTHTMDCDGEWMNEYESGTFYPDIEQIDLIIKRLNQAKKYLQE
jgi:hypothetical protein